MNYLPEQIGAIILAAGASTRMGTPKQLLPLHHSSFLQYTILVTLKSVCRPIIVVLGAYAQQIRPEISQLPVDIVENFQWTEGMSSSIGVGLTALKTQSNPLKAVVLLVCDQPFISSQLIDQIVQTYQVTGKPIVASEYDGVLGVPALFDHTMFSELFNLKTSEGAKQVIRKHTFKVTRVDFPKGAIDIDTPEEYKDFLKAIP